MRPIHLARLDKIRPVVVLTRATVRAARAKVTVVPITGTIRGLVSEVPVDQANGLDKDSVVNCDNIQTIPADDLGRRIGYLLPSQEQLLADAIHAAFDLA